MESMAKRLSDLLTMKGIKGADLADATSVNASSVSRILRGTQVPTVDTLFKFAQYFDVTMEFLLTGENSSAQSTATNHTSAEAKLIAYYRKMSITDQKDLLLIAEMKANKEKVEIN